MERFIQKKIDFKEEVSTGQLKVSTLVSLLKDHPYFKEVTTTFHVQEIAEEVIVIDHIDVVFRRIKFLNENFKKFNIVAYAKDITITQNASPISDIADPNPFVFNFENAVDSDGVINEYSGFALYNSKNAFLDEYDMAKYANRLYKEGLGNLANHNLQALKVLAATEPRFNKRKSYRLVESDGDLFVRAITSTNRYYEYGVDFTFVVTMLMLHREMKRNEGNNYEISSAAVSESKLELIISEKYTVDANEFGQVSSALVVSTNDIGLASLNFTNIIRVGITKVHGVFLFPKPEHTVENKVVMAHSTSLDHVLRKLHDVMGIVGNAIDLVAQLKEVKGIKTPDELRSQIHMRLSSPQSAFRNIQSLKDLFKMPIENEIKSFVKLLDMCNKAEELDIDYDLKDKLRYIISDIILAKGK